jgi:hypothetical protein
MGRNGTARNGWLAAQHEVVGHVGQERVDAGVYCAARGVDDKFRGFGFFVRSVDPGEIGDFAGSCLLLEVLGVAGFADREVRFDEDLVERAVLSGLARARAV